MIPSNDIDKHPQNPNQLFDFEISKIYRTKVKSQVGSMQDIIQVFIQIHRAKSRGSAEPICQGTIWSHQPPTILLVALDTIQHDHKARCHIG